MRVLSGRLKAVLVAILATIVLVGVIGPASTLASDPPGLARFMEPSDRSSRRRLLPPGTPRPAPTASTRSCRRAGAPGRRATSATPTRKPTPANQEIVAAAKFRALYARLGSWRRVAYWWLTGSSRTYRLVVLRDPLRRPGS